MENELTLQEEQAAFDEQTDALLPTHAGKFVLFKGGRPIEFFDDHVAAYKAGLERFGPDRPFLVAEVAKQIPQPVSVAWDAGVMFG
jgi:hypothetical protein